MRDLSEVNRRAEMLVVSVPIEFEFLLNDQGDGVDALAQYLSALGSYSSVQNCQLQALQRRGIDSGQRVKCRVLKFSLRSAEQ